MVVFPPAKINLGLRILKKRSDGYHDLETLFYPVNWCDILEAVPAAGTKGKLQVSGNRVDVDWPSNLVWQAWQELCKRKPLPAIDFYLHKNIPSGAGLGGGSSDAAFVLRLADALFPGTFSAQELSELAAKLGSDCPFFLQDQPCLASGKGEILQPVPFFLSGIHILVIKPERSISTAEAYRKVLPMERSDSLIQLISQPRSEWRQYLMNDFEAALFPLYPDLEEIRESLYESGAFYAAMSGSGSSIFGLFEQDIKVSEPLQQFTHYKGKLT